MSHIRNVPWKEVPEAEAAAAPKRSRGPKRHIQLHEALHGGDEKRARALLAQGADPNRRHATVEFTMQYVIWRRVGLSFARELVAAGFDLSKRRQGYTAMQKAIWADAADVVAELLELGASPTQPDAFRRDPLALSAHAGAFACVELFLRRGPEPRSIQRAIRAGDKRLEPFWRELSVDEERNIRKALELLRAATE
jgi:ankyrin repeat protein